LPEEQRRPWEDEAGVRLENLQQQRQVGGPPRPPQRRPRRVTGAWNMNDERYAFGTQKVAQMLVRAGEGHFRGGLTRVAGACIDEQAYLVPATGISLSSKGARYCCARKHFGFCRERDAPVEPSYKTCLQALLNVAEGPLIRATVEEPVPQGEDAGGREPLEPKPLSAEALQSMVDALRKVHRGIRGARVACFWIDGRFSFPGSGCWFADSRDVPGCPQSWVNLTRTEIAETHADRNC
jgi:hypothetical protein